MWSLSSLRDGMSMPLTCGSQAAPNDGLIRSACIHLMPLCHKHTLNLTLMFVEHDNNQKHTPFAHSLVMYLSLLFLPISPPLSLHLCPSQLSLCLSLSFCAPSSFSPSSFFSRNGFSDWNRAHGRPCPFQTFHIF